jgi:Divergent InlB B-repeat domain
MRKLVLALTVVASLWLTPGAFAAWCGSGETPSDLPDVVTGRQIHAIVALPADAPDTFADNANGLADDVTSMVSWWQGQDSTRIPNFDQASYPGGRCLDISLVRLPDPTARYAGTGANSDFQTLEQQLFGDGFSSPYKKYLVYYPGATADADICGTGAGDIDQGPSYAVVWLAGCPDVPIDTVATHELLHALGAVPPGDPHCPSDPAHPCDSPTDVLYPYTSGEPLSQKVLDFNHDDYYGHSQPWPDVQDSLWLHRLDEQPVALAVGFSGGAGTVTSDVPGVDCTAACSTQWDPGTVVNLDAEPSGADRFVKWTGACTGGGDCQLTLAQADSATAVFGPLRIPLHITTVGKGKVTCTPKCAKTLAAGNFLSLKAVATKGWRFAGWGDACKGVRLTCTPATDYGLSVTARFRKR